MSLKPHGLGLKTGFRYLSAGEYFEGGAEYVRNY